jgi:hypothetical protein
MTDHPKCLLSINFHAKHPRLDLFVSHQRRVERDTNGLSRVIGSSIGEVHALDIIEVEILMIA